VLALALGAGSVGCGDSGDADEVAGGAGGGAGQGAGQGAGGRAAAGGGASGAGAGAGGMPGPQPGGAPPAKLADVEAFLTSGAYLPENDANWLCGEKGQIVVGISPHTKTDGTSIARICATKSVADDSNFVATGPNKGWPVGIAAVKEIFDDPSNPDVLLRYAYYTKTKDAWYWYEGFPDRPGEPDVGLSLAPCETCHRNELEFVRKANQIDEEDTLPL
jgi:hypothetical protein